MNQCYAAAFPKYSIHFLCSCLKHQMLKLLKISFYKVLKKASINVPNYTFTKTKIHIHDIHGTRFKLAKLASNLQKDTNCIVHGSLLAEINTYFVGCSSIIYVCISTIYSPILS